MNLMYQIHEMGAYKFVSNEFNMEITKCHEIKKMKKIMSASFHVCKNRFGHLTSKL